MGDFALEVLHTLAECDCQSSLWWRTDNEYAPVSFFINCNDFFYWATADAEPVTPDNLRALQQAIKDGQEAEETKFTIWGPLLFCARQRGLRPQRPAYPTEPPAVVALFDACGPERDRASEG